MRHQKHGRKFGRKSAHRHAMFSNMVASLITHERIQTTDAKAKELRRIVERTITWSVSLGDLLTKDADKLDAEDQSRKLHAVRMARRVLKQPDALHKLFNDVGPRLIGRTGGYTRIMKLKNRHGDAAPISIIELVDRVAPGADDDDKTKAAGKKAGAKAAGAEAASEG